MQSYDSLHLDSYASLDIRLKGGGPQVIEVNPNPCLSRTYFFALVAESQGISYEGLIRRIALGALSGKSRLMA